MKNVHVDGNENLDVARYPNGEVVIYEKTTVLYGQDDLVEGCQVVFHPSVEEKLAIASGASIVVSLPGCVTPPELRADCEYIMDAPPPETGMEKWCRAFYEAGGHNVVPWDKLPDGIQNLWRARVQVLWDLFTAKEAEDGNRP